MKPGSFDTGFETTEVARDLRWRHALDCAQLGVWDADLVRDECYYSPSWKRMLGYDEHELDDSSDLWLAFIHPEDRQRAIESGDKHLAGSTQFIETEFRLRHRDGRWIWVLDRGQVLERDAAGRPTRMMGVQADITAQKELARRDALTGLLNRGAFDDILASALSTTRDDGRALFYMDLDRFKFVNDTVGHAAGDALLKLVAEALVSALPADSVIARLGGDEFAAVIDIADPEQAHRVARDLLGRIRTQKLQWAGRSHEVGASIGVAFLRDLELDPVAALACADAACYAAKSLGRNRAVIHNPAVGVSQWGSANVQAASELVDALKDGRIVLYGQEIRPLSDLHGVCRHVEVLARLTGSDGSLMLPNRFIPAAERFGLMGAFDRRVIRQSLQALRLSGLGETDLTLAINLSAISLSDPYLWPSIQAMMAEFGTAPASLCFEITESAAIDNFETAVHFVREARAAGCRISLDDFGSGLSSLSYLRRFTVDFIKIDGAFIEELSQDPVNQTICAAIGMIAAELGSDVVAERIEDSSAIEILQSRGIGYGQGYLMHRPEPLDAILQRHKPCPLPGRRRARAKAA